MLKVLQIIKFRRQHRVKELSSLWVKLGVISALGATLVIVVITAGVAWFYLGMVKDLPDAGELPALVEPPDGDLFYPTRLYDRSGEHAILTLENPAATGKQYITIGQAGQQPRSQAIQYLVDATITKLDHGFWRHGGYSLAGIMDGAHPTLAQKLVSELLLADEPPSLKRNLRERWLAAALTARYGREKVLEWYINTAKYGEFIYGVDAAAHAYFGKSANDLTLAEAAMITALVETPEINLDSGFQSLKQEQELIIQHLLVDGRISAQETQAALQEATHFQAPLQTHALAPAFTQLVLARLESQGLLAKLSRGGYKVVTSLDYDLQVQALCATRAQLALSQGVEEPVNTIEGNACQADELLPVLQKGAGSLLGDLVAEVVIIDPQTGHVVAFTGGEGIGLQSAVPDEHPAGAILSPLMYLAAFTRGFSPASLLWDIPSDGQSSLAMIPQTSFHGPVSLREAFSLDYPGAATQVIDQVGLDTILLTEQQFGIAMPDIPGELTAGLQSLYSQPVSLLRATGSYAVLANQGIMAGDSAQEYPYPGEMPALAPTVILEISSLGGQVVSDKEAFRSIPVVSSQIAYLTTHVLSDESFRQSMIVEPGTLDIGQPVAVKTSLAGDAKAAWVVGYTPQLSVGVWLGYTLRDSGGISAQVAAGLWKAILQYASKDMPIQDFSIPDGISTLKVCEPSGMLETPLCPNVVPEVFLVGNEPTREDDLYRKFFIDRETGLLATIFTPPGKVDEQVFLMVPPQAVDWAKQADVPSPPAQYDSIDELPPLITSTQFTDPHMFDDIGGKVVFTGVAAGEGFSYYRLQVGKGLNPQEWLQLGEDVDTPVEGGKLGEWDTSGLHGVYIAQLMVVRQDRRVDRALLQVRIDNTPPQVQILGPREGEQAAFIQDQKVMLNIQATDDLGVQRVELYVDGKLVSTLLKPPYTTLWKAAPGSHDFEVTVYDAAGNQASAGSAFQVSSH